MRRTWILPVALVAFTAGCLDLRNPIDDPDRAPRLLYEPDCSIANWSDRCVARASPNDSPSKTEIDIVVNPTDPLNVFVASKDLDRDASGCVWAVGQASHDGGHTWTTSYVGGTKDERQPTDPLYGWGCITDPIMSYDPQGRLYYALQAYNYGTESNEPPNPCQLATVPGGTNSGSQFFLAMSDDGGLGWNRFITLHTGEGNVIFHDYPRMATNPVTGSVFVIWNQFNTVGPPCDPVGVGTGALTPIVSGTRDRGENPITPVYLIPPQHPDFGNFDINGFSAGSGGDEGTLFVTLDTENGNTSTVYLIVSRDDGRTWSSPARIFDYTQVTADPGQGRAHTPTTRFRAGSSVELAADNTDGPFGGCLFANWIDNRTGDWNVLSSRSCDGGDQWTEPSPINKDTQGAYQFMTRPTVTDDGVWHVVYQTQAYDPGMKLLDAEYGFSEDGGDMWTTTRLTQVGSNGDLGIHQDGGSFFGDYNGIAASGTTVYAGFAHTLTGKAEIAVARIVRSE